MAGGYGADSQEGGYHWDLGLFGQISHQPVSMGDEDTVARHDDGPFGLVNQIGGGGYLGLGRYRRDLVPREFGLTGPDKLGFIAQQNVPGDVYQDGPRTSGAGYVEGVVDGLGDVFHVHDQHVVLGDGQSYPGYVGLLESVAADGGPGHLSGDGHYGDRIHLGGGDAGDHICRAGSRRRDADADLARGPGVAVGGHGGGLFVAHQDMADGRVDG